MGKINFKQLLESDYFNLSTGSLKLPQGTSFPTGAEGDVFWRTDTGKLYVKDGDNWTEIAGGGGVTDHGALTGLTDDDHTGYLLANGTRAMVGNLNMGSQNITSVGNVDGVDVSGLSSTVTNHTADTSIHFTVGSISHTAITNIGTNTHTQIDSHISNSAIHTSTSHTHDDRYFTETESDLRFAPIANGVTSGNSHDHNGGDGAQISHANLSTLQGGSIGEYNHLTNAQISALHASTTVSAAPLTIIGQQLTFNYDANDFNLSGNNLQILDSGIDHGSISGLSDDDHPQYILVDGSRGFTGTVSGVTPVLPGDLCTKGYLDIIKNATKEPTGFLLRTSTSTFSFSFPTFTITPVSGTFDIYSSGVLFQKGVSTVDITNTKGTWYIAFNTSGSLEASQIPWNFVDGKVAVATLYWNGVEGLLGDERHGIIMDGMTHGYLHYSVGTRYVSGLTGTFTDTTFEVTEGEIYDEDIRFSIDTTTQCRIMYRSGTDFLFTAAQTKYYTEVSNILQYDNAGTLTDVDNNKYVAMWIFATNNLTNPIYALVGQRQDTLLANARTNNTYESLSLGNLPFQEMKILYRVLVRRNGTNETYVETQDLRSISNLPAGTYVASDHGLLTGLTDDDHSQYIPVDGTRGFTGTVSGITPISTNDLATKFYVDDTIAGSTYELKDLTDVSDSDTPAKNDVLKFNGTEWVFVPYTTSFTFAIASFTCTSGATGTAFEIGTGDWKAIGAMSFSATYTNGPATGGYVSHTGWSNLTLTGTGYVGPTVNVTAVAYPSVGSSSAYTLNATDGTDPTTSTITYYFYNRRFWGVSTVASSYSEANIEGLANNELSNSKSKTFTVTAGTNEYIIFSYPSRLGTATFTVGGFGGGFQSPETVSITNALSYTENYYVYRSTNHSLGATTVVVS